MVRKLFIYLTLAGMPLLAMMSIATAQNPSPQGGIDAQAVVGTSSSAALGTDFTYQGQLTYGGVPVNSACDFQFSLWDAQGSGSPPAGGNQVGTTLPQPNIAVISGLFTVQLDFGSSVFNGDAHWLQTAVCCPAGSGVHTTLAPRQSLTAAPYALYALTAAPHHHLGQAWIGSGNPLVITGTFGGPDYAPLVLGNTHANGFGVRVERAGVAGVHVAEAGVAGVWVSQAGEYGVGVYKAGNPSSLSMSTFHDGFEVWGAEGYGLYVGRADMDGVHVWSAGGDGVHVRSAGEDGVDATSTSASDYGGRFVNSASGGAGLYARSGDGNAADIELGSNSNTGIGDNGRVHSTGYGSSDLYLTSNDDVTIELDKNEDEVGTLRVDVSGLPVFQVDESGDAKQARSADGLVKAGVTAVCGVVDSQIVRSFNNVNDEAIWIANGANPGQCQINFGFDVSDRYIVATAAGDHVARGVSVGLVAVGNSAPFFRWIAATGTGKNGLIYVLVY